MRRGRLASDDKRAEGGLQGHCIDNSLGEMRGRDRATEPIASALYSRPGAHDGVKCSLLRRRRDDGLCQAVGQIASSGHGFA